MVLILAIILYLWLFEQTKHRIWTCTVRHLHLCAPPTKSAESCSHPRLQEIAFPKMVASCCRFLCYFCRISRQNQKAMFDHLSYLLENSSVGLGEFSPTVPSPSLYIGSTVSFFFFALQLLFGFLEGFNVTSESPFVLESERYGASLMQNWNWLKFSCKTQEGFVVSKA